MDTVTIIVFTVGTAVIAAVSRRSLLHPGSHGFYRFFAWEGMLLLSLLNGQFWIDDPASLHQIISWLLLTASLYPVISAVILLRIVGKPGTGIAPGADFAFEKTTHLVTSGVYNYIRHPMYASLLYLAWGIFFKNISPVTFGIVVIVSVLLYITAKTEEKEDLSHFGEGYRDYAARTKMFVPFLW